MKTRARLGAIASALLLIGALAASADGTTLKIGQVGDIRSLEPYRNATPNYLFIENLYDQLLFNPLNGGFEGEAAESWEISSDFTTVTVKLRDGMVSHDGTPADAHMLKWDIEERRKGWGRSDMPVFGGVDATVNVIDDLTAEITLGEPFANMETKLSLFMLTDADMYLRDDGAVAEFNQEDKVIGSGPFMLVEYEPGSHMRWEKFTDHWDADSVMIERVEITFFGDAVSMVAALEAGEIDLAYRPPYAGRGALPGRLRLYRLGSGDRRSGLDPDGQPQRARAGRPARAPGGQLGDQPRIDLRRDLRGAGHAYLLTGGSVELRLHAGAGRHSGAG